MTSGKRWSRFQAAVKTILIEQHGVSSERAGEFCQQLKKKEDEWHKLQTSARDAAGNLAANKIINAYKLHNTRTVTKGQAESTPTACCTKDYSSPGAQPKVGLSKSKVGAKRKVADDTLSSQWSSLQVADDMPLFYENTGYKAEKLDLDDEVEELTGYHFCRIEQALKLLRKFGDSQMNPILFILPYTKEAEQKSLDLILAKPLATQNISHSFKPLLEEKSILVTNPKSANPNQEHPMDCLFLNIHKDDKIQPAHGMQTEDAFKAVGNKPAPMANLVFQPCGTTDVQVAVLEPICREVGLATWFKELSRLAEKDFGKLRESLKKLVLHPKVKQPQVRVRRSRNLRWRGDELPDGRISATFAIPNECVEDILARSGCNGAIYDLPGAAEIDKYNYAKVKLPCDLTMQQAIAKVDELGTEL